MKVLLVNPLMSAEPCVYFPLGLGYIAMVLLNDGHQVSVLDINACKWDSDEVEKEIIASDFDVVGVSALITQYSYVKWLTKTVRELNRSSKIIVGGGLATSVPETVLRKTETDIVVIGEGEITIKELLNALDDSKRLDNVKGIMFKESDKIYQTESRKVIENLDDIPFPTRKLFPMDKYIGNLFLGLFDRSIRGTNLITSRGCPYNCIFCDKGTFGQKFRARSPENIIAEIKLLIDEYEINGVAFNDDMFVLNKERVHLFCDKLIAGNINIYWACNGRVNLMDESLLKKMHNAGCRVIAYGIESGNQGILDALNKKTTVEQGKEAIELTWKAGIIPVPYLMAGMFGESEATIRDTINFCRRLGVRWAFSFVTPLPGTPLYQKAKDLGKIKNTEEQLMEDNRLQGISKNLVINLTDMPDEKLIKLKEDAEQEIQKIPLIISWRLIRIKGAKRSIKNLFIRIWTVCKREGVKVAIKKALREVQIKIGV